MHDSPVHRQPVRIIKKPAQGIYIPSDQQIKKRILPEFLRRGKKARVTTIPDMMVSFGDAAAAEPKVQKARIGSRLRPFLPKVPRGIFYSGLSLLLCIFCVLVLSSGALSAKESRTPVIMEEDPMISRLLVENMDFGESPEESGEALPEIPQSIEYGEYRVLKGDSLERIAKKFGVRIDTLISLNRISNVKQLQAGSLMKIPNMDGIIHTVQKGDSLASIAKRYSTDVITLADTNNLQQRELQIKQILFIPGAKLPAEDLKRALGTYILWPLRGTLTSYFGYRQSPFTGIRQFHNGIDIRANDGTSVKAAMDGTVAETGYSTVFGNFIIIKHSGGYQTLYGHLSKIKVVVNQRVNQGAVIGLSGNTGLTTGPHLHFAIFKNGNAVNPLSILGK